MSSRFIPPELWRRGKIDKVITQKNQLHGFRHVIFGNTSWPHEGRNFCGRTNYLRSTATPWSLAKAEGNILKHAAEKSDASLRKEIDFREARIYFGKECVAMDKSNKLVAVILAVSAVLFVSGVIKKFRVAFNQRTQKVIAVIPKGTTNMWWETVNLGAQQAGKEANVKILWIGPEMETDRERQIQAVDDVLVQNVDAVVLGPNDFKALVRSTEKIVERGIPCIIIDSPVDTDCYDAFAATDNYQGGVNAAKRLGTALNGHGTVILMHYVQNSASTEERARGFKETLARDFPGIKIGAQQYTTLGTVEDARQRTTDMLTRLGKVDGIYAVNQPSSVGAYKALQTSGNAGKIHFVGFDSDPVLLTGIENNEIDALIVQNPFEIGYQGVQLALKKLAGEKLEKTNNVPSMIVDKTNLEEMKKRFPSALGL